MARSSHERLPGATWLDSQSLSRYNGMLRFDVSRAGLRLSVLPLFRPGHRPFFVPWSEVSAEARRRLLFETWVLIATLEPASSSHL